MTRIVSAIRYKCEVNCTGGSPVSCNRCQRRTNGYCWVLTPDCTITVHLCTRSYIQNHTKHILILTVQDCTSASLLLVKAPAATAAAGVGCYLPGTQTGPELRSSQRSSDLQGTFLLAQVSFSVIVTGITSTDCGYHQRLTVASRPGPRPRPPATTHTYVHIYRHRCAPYSVGNYCTRSVFTSAMSLDNPVTLTHKLLYFMFIQTVPIASYVQRYVQR